MAVFLLVHGAMHGGWCWRKLVRVLQKEGHEVFTPTLTGMGERSHLLTRETGLYTHVDDLLGILKFEDLSDLIVVGHSYAGLVITKLAEAAFERIQHLIYLAAFGPGRSVSLRCTDKSN
ncbi:MAG: alpha/beta fold hydrolase [Methanotrichaceae archaeon]